MAVIPVTFYWLNDNGVCNNCGLPAAFRLIGHPAYGSENWDAWKRCSVCAANDAADGERIARIGD